MNIEAAGAGTLVVVLAMAVVTLATRWGGVYVMSFVPINRRVRQFIQAMSGSVLVAFIAPMAISGDSASKLALFITASVVLWLKRPLPAIACGIVAAALMRRF